MNGGRSERAKKGEEKVKKKDVGGWKEGPPHFIRDGPALQLLFIINKQNKRDHVTLDPTTPHCATYSHAALAAAWPLSVWHFQALKVRPDSAATLVERGPHYD